MVSLALALCLSTASDPTANLRFEAGTLHSWQARGDFYLTTANGRGPGLQLGVCSSDRGTVGRTGTLERTFVLPADVQAIHFRAFVSSPKDVPTDERLDMQLRCGNRLLPREAREGQSWQPAPQLLPAVRGRAREYRWRVAGLAGQTVQLRLVDDDARRGCHLFCSGFRLQRAPVDSSREFSWEMVRLAKEHRLAPMARFDSRHFLALSNADDAFTEARLRDAEAIYRAFFAHFRAYGFRVEEPKERLSAAVFDSQAGFEAYLGQAMPTSVTGLYHYGTNRLVIYDFGRNKGLLSQQKQAVDNSRRYTLDMDRLRYLDAVTRQVEDLRSDTNVSTIMHEVAHQLAFNGGLMNRQGDAPLWLIEGLACWCEATTNGTWRGIGEPNLARIATLERVLRGQGRFYSLQELLGDDWLAKPGKDQSPVVGYAQSWALFHLFMKEQPRDLKKFMELVYPRRTNDHRTADFGQVFGSDLKKLDRCLQEHIRSLVDQHGRRKP